MTDIDVTVVVPVYNSGPAIDSCIDSLLAQTIPADRLEIIFSDDGSTDGTQDKLDRLAAEHPHVHVIHSPNSGWPGRPRNLGIEAAKGEYIQFVDHDDSLGPEALERLVAFGRAHAADIVIGKVTSDFRPVPNDLFRRNIERGTVWDSHLSSSLTPHKMFRREFLMRTRIRYPEGKVRLEDQLFMMQTYFAASSTAVLADYPCYFYSRRPEGTHAAAEVVEPAVYYHYVREVLDVIVANTEPGEFRNDTLRRFWRAVIRLGGHGVTRPRPPGYNEKFFPVVMSMAADYFPSEVGDGLPTFGRAQSMLLHADRLDLFEDLTRRQDVAIPDVRLESLDWTGTAWQLTVTGRLIHQDGTPLAVVPAGDGWRPDLRLIPDYVDLAPQSLEDLLAESKGDVILRDRETGVRWFAPSQWTATFAARTDDPNGPRELILSGVVEIDPTTAAVGNPLTTAVWDLAGIIDSYGVRRQVRLAAGPAGGTSMLPVLFRPPARVVVPIVKKTGNLSIDVRAPVASVAGAVSKRVTDIAVVDGELVAPIGMRLAGGPDVTSCTVMIGDVAMPATIRGTTDGAELRCSLTGVRRLPSGRSPIKLVVRADDPPKAIGEIVVGRRGRVSAVTGR